MVRLVQINESGRRCRETHHRAKLTDAQVEAARQAHEDHGKSYSVIAAEFGVSKSAVAMICQFLRRADSVYVWRAR